MRVRLDDGRIVEVPHFKLCRAHVYILMDLQREVENMIIQCSPENGGPVLFLPVYRFKLDMKEIRDLNPTIY